METAIREQDAEPVTNPYLARNPSPTGVPSVPLSDRQLDHMEVELQRASKVLHNRTQLVAGGQEVGAVLLAAAGMASAILDVGQSQVAIAGFIWFITSSFVLGHVAKGFTEGAALIQEAFDRRLFTLDWNETLHSSDPVNQPRVLNLAGKLRPDSSAEREIQAGWYDPTDGLEYPYDVLVSQEQNLCWDVRLRRRFKLTLGVLGSVWTLLGFGIALSGTSVAETLLVIFVPAAAAYDLGRDRWRVQHAVATERGRCAALVSAALAAAEPGALTSDQREDLVLLASQVQDVIFRTRAEFGRVPAILYSRRKDKDESEFATIAEGHRTRLVGS